MKRKARFVGLYLTLAILCLSAADNSASTANAAGVAQRLGALTAELRQSVSGKASVHSDSFGRLARERFDLMRSLSERDPISAWNDRLSDEELDRVPVQYRGLFEKSETLQGTLEVIAECDEKTSRTLYFVNSGGEHIRVNLGSKPDRELITGQMVRISGMRLKDQLTTSESFETVVPNGENLVSTQQTVNNLLPNTFGDHKVAVILVNFQDLQTQPYTPAQAQDTTFNTTSNFFRENSYGQTWLTGDVYGWFTIPVSSTSCDTTSIATYAQQAATKAGANLANYSHYVYAFPQTSACAFSGRSTVGGNPSQSWINSSALGIGVLSHELGHTLGLQHSRSLDCGTETLGATCTTDEYGDRFDTMGSTGGAHYNSFQKERLGWLNNGISPQILTVNSSGTYRLENYETASNDTKALKILRSTDPVSGARTWFYLEHRSAIGFDGYLSYYGIDNGVVVRSGAEGNGTGTYLLDTTPETINWYDSPLTSGKTFSDPASGVSVTTLSADSSGAWIQITLSAQPCVHANPAVSVSPGKSPWLVSGSPFTYSVSILNNDGAGCGVSTFSVNVSAPTGWGSSPTVSSINLSPGASGSAAISVTSLIGAPDASYGLSAQVANSSFSGYAATIPLTYSIVTGLKVVESSSAASYTRSQTAKVTASVSGGGSPLSGSAIVFTMVRPNGTTVTSSATTDANGNAIFQYPFNRKKDPTGTYQVRSQVNSNGLSGSGITSFTVK
jgi:hypothetical protein